MSANAVKIAISLPKEDFKLLEAIRKKMGITRSALIDKAIHYWLNKRKEEQMIKQYEEGYRRIPESPDEYIPIEKSGLEAFDPEEKWE